MKLYKFPNQIELVNLDGDIFEKPCEGDEVITIKLDKLRSVDDLLLIGEDDDSSFKIFPRKCNRCLKGIHEGYVVHHNNFCGECIDKYCEDIGYDNWDSFLHRDENDNFIPEDKREEDLDYTTDDCYWTEWEIDITDCVYLENGLEIDLNYEIKHRLLLTLSEMIDGQESTQKCLIAVGNDESIEECVDKYISEFRGEDSEKEGHLHYSFLGGSISVKFDNYKVLTLDEYSLLEKLFYGVGEYIF